MTKKIVEDAREIEVKGEYDVLVIGGGGAGIAAGIAAARSGAKALLAERYGFLGGMATAGMVGSFCGFFTTGAAKPARATQGPGLGHRKRGFKGRSQDCFHAI